MSIQRYVRKLFPRRAESLATPLEELRRGNFSRRRGLKSLKKVFGPEAVLAAIESALSSGGSEARLLEIGCGEGRVMLELAQAFPALEIHGINKRPWPAMTGSDSLREAAVHYGILEQHEMDSLRWPEVHFQNAEQLQFADAFFDVIVSQVAVPHMHRKNLVLEEAWRVLKPGGRALLEVDAWNPKMPRSHQCATPRFVVQEQGRLTSLHDIVQEQAEQGFAIRMQSTGKSIRRISVLMEKNRPEPLRLGLILDSAASIGLASLRPQNAVHSAQSPFWGFKSVYRRADG